MGDGSPLCVIVDDPIALAVLLFGIPENIIMVDGVDSIHFISHSLSRMLSILVLAPVTEIVIGCFILESVRLLFKLQFYYYIITGCGKGEGKSKKEKKGRQVIDLGLGILFW